MKEGVELPPYQENSDDPDFFTADELQEIIDRILGGEKSEK